MLVLAEGRPSAHLCGGPSPCTAWGTGLAEGRGPGGGPGPQRPPMPPQPSLLRQQAVQGEQGDAWAGRRAAPIHVKRGFLDPGQRKGSLFPASQPTFTVQGSPSRAMSVPAPSPAPQPLLILCSGAEPSPFHPGPAFSPGSRISKPYRTNAKLKGQTSMISSCEGRRGFVND